MALYALMIAMPVTGYMTSGAGKHDIPWFGLFNFPNLMPARQGARGRGRLRRTIVFAWAIAVVLALHLGAVVWHAGVRRDTILTRMWPGYRPASADCDIVIRIALQDPLTLRAALTGQARASGSACATLSAKAEAGSLFHVDRTVGARMTPTPTR